MKKILLIAVFLNLLFFQGYGQKVYWENMNEQWKKEILSNRNVDQCILKYYQGKQSIMMLKDEEIEYILKTLVENKNDSLREFYFFVFNKICAQSDGFLSDEMGDYCIALISNDPQYVFGYFAQRVRAHDLEVLKLYADFIGSQLHFEKGSESDRYYYGSFRNKLEKASINFTAREKNALVLFLKRVEIMIKKMNNGN